jgi:prephenate dehydrogenase
MIGIIGYGRFGRLAARYLADDYDVYVYNRKDAVGAGEKGRIFGVSLEETCRQPNVLLSVPISALQECLQRIAPLLDPQSLVIDVCSVKEYPVQWMKAQLPETVSILATHPMFGPDSAGESLAGMKIALCPIRLPADRYRIIRTYLEGRQLRVLETTPEEHDRQIAVSLALTHFIGRSLASFKAPELPIDTEGYQRLLHILGVVEHDTWQLFADMHRYNPYAEDTRLRFMAAMNRIHEALKTSGS